MPGPVSDSYHPEFGTGDKASRVTDGITKVRDKIGKTLGPELKYIVDVVDGKQGEKVSITLSERERRIIRYAMNTVLEWI